jgi:hypothetical protein
MSRVGRGLLWVVASCAVLFLGFAALVLGMYLLGGLTVGAKAQTLADRLMTAIYFRVVFFKGLLPELLLALALWPGVRRLLPGVERGVARRAGGLALAALVAHAVVAPLLLSVDFPGWPALQMPGLEHKLGTALTSVAGVVAAALAGYRLSHGRRADPQPSGLAGSEV